MYKITLLQKQRLLQTQNFSVSSAAEHLGHSKVQRKIFMHIKVQLGLWE